MYCVKCGVKLPDGERACPLCHTPVLYMDDADREESYSDRYPAERRHGKYVLLSLITALMLAAGLICLILCLKTFGRVYWSGYVLLGLALAWIILILPQWFRRFLPFVFLPIDYAAVCGFLLYVCASTGGHWFLSFAFPVTLLHGAVLLGTVALFRHARRGRLLRVGALMIVMGLYCMLIELFQHITFGTPMFLWSLYCVSAFGAIGLFLLIASLIPPLKAFLERKFFI